MYWLFPSINPYISRLQIFHKEDSYDYDFDDFEHLNNPNENETNRESCTTINVLPSSKNITNIIDDNIFLDDPNFVDNLPKRTISNIFDYNKKKPDRTKCYERLIILFHSLTLVLCLIAYILAIKGSNSYYSDNMPYILIGKIIVLGIKRDENHTWERIFKMRHTNNITDILYGCDERVTKIVDDNTGT